MDRFGVTDYHAIQRITEFGYEETKRRIELDGLPTVV